MSELHNVLKALGVQTLHIHSTACQFEQDRDIDKFDVKSLVRLLQYGAQRFINDKINNVPDLDDRKKALDMWLNRLKTGELKSATKRQSVDPVAKEMKRIIINDLHTLLCCTKKKAGEIYAEQNQDNSARIVAEALLKANNMEPNDQNITKVSDDYLAKAIKSANEIVKNTSGLTSINLDL